MEERRLRNILLVLVSVLVVSLVGIASWRVSVNGMPKDAFNNEYYLRAKFGDTNIVNAYNYTLNKNTNLNFEYLRKTYILVPAT